MALARTVGCSWLPARSCAGQGSWLSAATARFRAITLRRTVSTHLVPPPCLPCCSPCCRELEAGTWPSETVSDFALGVIFTWVPVAFIVARYLLVKCEHHRHAAVIAMLRPWPCHSHSSRRERRSPPEGPAAAAAAHKTDGFLISACYAREPFRPCLPRQGGCMQRTRARAMPSLRLGSPTRRASS